MPYVFEWGDGSPPTSQEENVATHDYAQPGSYTIRVTTPEGGSGSCHFLAGAADSEPLQVDYSLGVENGQAIVGGGPTDGVRLAVADANGTELSLSELVTIDWGDGQLDSPPDISQDFVAHRYLKALSEVRPGVESADGQAGYGPPFQVVEEGAAGAGSGRRRAR